MNVQQTDVAIVGAGPIGLEIAVALKKAGIDYLHFDTKQVGQTVSWFAPGTRFFSSNDRIAIAGVPLQTDDQGKATREQYLAYLRSVVLQFDLKINCYEPVVGIESTVRGLRLTTTPTSGEKQYLARKVILATGGTDRPRRLNIPGEDLPHVSHYFQDPHTYFRQNLLIVGGKNSAVEAALRCHHAGARVAMSYRRPALPEKSIKYWLLPEITGLLASKRIAGYMNTVPVRISPTHVSLQVCDDQYRPCGDTLEVPTDFVLLLTGYVQDNSLLKTAGVELTGTDQCPVYDARTMETNVPGVYVAGTATGGTQQRYTVFIENCHVHTERILAAIQGTSRDIVAPQYAAPES